MAVFGRKQIDTMCCSFCRKSKEDVGKLISSPDDRSRAYICNECVDICRSIIEDEKRDDEPEGPAMGEEWRFRQHPRAGEFLAAAERWAFRDLRGLPSGQELDEMRNLAVRMVTQRVSPDVETT